MINVMVFPCGSEIGLEVNNALKNNKSINLYGLNSVPCHGKMVYKNYLEGISFITESSFLDELNSIIDQNQIDIIVPAFDDVILYLSEHRDELHCKLATSNKETCDICRSKKKTYELLSNESYTPTVFDYDSITADVLPVFAKPDIGQGSQGVRIIKTLYDLDSMKNNKDAYVFSELLPGQEYTVDCFTDSGGDLIVASMRERKRVRMGISVNTVTRPVPEEVMGIAESINKKIVFNGVWFFQVKLDANGSYKLLEIAPRVSGSMATSRVRGFNYVLNMLYQQMGYKIKAIPHLIEEVELDRAFSNKYRLSIDYNYVYIDFDDTISNKGIINTEVIAFLYQCLNNNMTIILLTRHAEHIHSTLKKLHIDSGIFSRIINIDKDTPKSHFIREGDSILIDDSFRERFDVSSECGIPVFDVDAVTALLDWRH